MEMDGSLIMFLTVSFFFFQIKKIIVSLARRDLTEYRSRFNEDKPIHRITTLFKLRKLKNRNAPY